MFEGIRINVDKITDPRSGELKILTPWGIQYLQPSLNCACPMQAAMAFAVALIEVPLDVRRPLRS
jgi:hypothetical protein